MVKCTILLFAFLACAPAALSQQLFESLGCGSGCSVEYFALNGPLTGNDGLRKVLVREVNSQYNETGTSKRSKTRQVWILADCQKRKINIASYSSTGLGSHSDASRWDRVVDEGTNYDIGVANIFRKLCR